MPNYRTSDHSGIKIFDVGADSFRAGGHKAVGCRHTGMVNEDLFDLGMILAGFN